MNTKDNTAQNITEVEKIIKYSFNDKHLGLGAITTGTYSNAHSSMPDNQFLDRPRLLDGKKRMLRFLYQFLSNPFPF